MNDNPNGLECAICEREYTREQSQSNRPNICNKCYAEENNPQEVPQLNKLAYIKLINDDITALDDFPECLEKDHIKAVLKASITHYYPEEVPQVKSVEPYYECPENASGLLADIDIFRVLRLPNEAVNRINLFVSSHTAPLQSRIEELEQQNADLKVAGQKLEGVLINIKTETDYMPDFYYDWINQVLNETDEILSDEQALNSKEETNKTT